MTGASRFLNKIYATDLDVSGTTTFAGISASSLTVSGNATVNGTTTLKGTSLTGTLTIVNTASANNNTVGLLIGNSGNGKQLRCMIDGFQAWNGTAVSNLYLNYWGGAVYFGTNTVSISGGVITSQNIKSNKAEITNGIFDRIKSTYHDIEHVANLGGVFLVTPTVKCIPTGSSPTLTALTVTAENTTRTNSNGDSVTYNYTLAITDSAFASNTIGGSTWTQYSEVKVSGTINGVALGTCDGFIKTLNTTNHILTVAIKYDGAQTPATPTDITTVKEFNVMLTSRYDSTNTTYYPVGIWMKARDNNGYTHISLYGGTDTAPTVRIGNLTGLGTVAGVNIDNFTDKWGIFTSNGFFKGAVVAEEGKIGGVNGWTIVAKRLYSGGNLGTDSSMYLATENLSGTVGGRSNASDWLFTIGSHFGVTNTGALYCNSLTLTGSINATSGTIGSNSTSSSRWQIGSTSIYNGTSSISSTTAGTYIGTDGIRNYKDANTFVSIYQGVITAKAVDLSGSINATSGTIGSNSTSGNRWQIGSTSIYNGTSSISSTTAGTYVGTDGIRNYKDANTYVSISQGVITAKAVNLTGTIHATGGEFGDANGYHVAVSSSDVGIFSDATTKIASYGATTTIGKTDSKNIYIDSQGLNIRTGSTVLAKYGKETVIGSDHGQCIKLNNGGFAFYDYVEDINLFSIGGDNVGTPRTKSGTYSTTTLTVSLDGFPKTGTAIKVGSTNAFTAGTSGTYTASSVTYKYDGGNIINISRATAASNASYQFSYTADYIAEPVVTVGKADGNNFVIETDRLSANGLLNMNGASYIDSYWWIDDLMGETIKTTFTGDGSNKDFELDHVDTISSIKVNNSTVTNYSYSDGYIKFTTAPANGAVIVVSYTTDQCTPRFCFRNGLPTGPTTDNIWSVTLGYDCWSKGAYAFAGGRLASAEGFASVAHGYNVKASGSCACAFGQGWATGECSFAESVGVASGMYAHAEGCNTEATGEGAHSAGGFSVASGDYSFAGNFNTVAQRRSQTVLGEWNIADTGGTDETTRGSYAFIIGNGSATTESNALTVDWDGQLMAHGGIAGYGANTGGRLINANLPELGGEFKIGDTGLRYFLATNSMTYNKPTVNDILGGSSAGDYEVLHLPWDNNGGWDAQLAVRNAGDRIVIRGGSGATNGVQNWTAWKTVAMIDDFTPVALTWTDTSVSQIASRSIKAWRCGRVIFLKLGIQFSSTIAQNSYVKIGTLTLPHAAKDYSEIIAPCSSSGAIMSQVKTDGTVNVYRYSATSATGWYRVMHVIML